MPNKDPAAAALGRKGGLARAKVLSPEQRREIAKKANSCRKANIAKRLREQAKEKNNAAQERGGSADNGSDSPEDQGAGE